MDNKGYISIYVVNVQQLILWIRDYKKKSRVDTVVLIIQWLLINCSTAPKSCTEVPNGFVLSFAHDLPVEAVEGRQGR